MRLRFSTILGAALACGCGSAFAQGGDLSGVTMRVLDDVSDVDTVILELDANRGEGEEGADGRRGVRGDDADAADAERPAGESAEEDRSDEPRDSKDLHHPDDDERSEGKLEDHDVEQPAVPPVP
jgi:hypothetical protein